MESWARQHGAKRGGKTMRDAVAILVTWSSFIAFGHALAVLCLGFLRNAEVDHGGVLLACVGLAPGAVALLLYAQLILFPGGPYWLHAGLPFAVFVLLYMSRIRFSGRLVDAYRALRPHRGWSALGTLVTVATLILITLTAVIAICLPIQTHDALIHASRGIMLAEDRSLAPFALTEPLSSGAYKNAQYPPGLSLVYAWTLLLQGGTQNDAGIRSIAPFCVVLTLLLLWRWGNRIEPSSGILAVFLLASLPIYMGQAATNSIDALRMLFILHAFYFLPLLVGTRSWIAGVLCVLALALAGFVHTLGLLALPVFGALFLAFSHAEALRRLAVGAGISIAAGLVGGIEYIRRLLLFGNWRAPLLHTPPDTTHILHARGLQYVSDVIIHGILRMFTDLGAFSVFGLLFLPSVVLGLLKHRRNRWFLLALAPALLLALLIWIAPSPSTPGWANARYIMTITPFMALCNGVLIRWVLRQRMQWLTKGWSVVFATVAALALLGFALLTPQIIVAIAATGGALPAASLSRITVARVALLAVGLFCGTCAALLIWPRRRPVMAILGALSLFSAAGAWLVSPEFVGHYLSPDNVLEAKTVAWILLTRAVLIAVAVGAAIGAAIVSRSRPNRLATFIDRTVRTVPFAILLAVVFALGVDGILSSKGARSYALQALARGRLGTEQLLEMRDYGPITSTLYLNENTSADARILFTEDAYFLYYSERDGIYWRDLRLEPFYDASSTSEAVQLLCDHGVTHLQISDRVRDDPLYLGSLWEEVLAPPHAELIWRHEGSGNTSVYRLIACREGP
jgi:hypothetical protein